MTETNGHIRILYDNRVARPGVTITASSAATPARRVASDRPGRRWRAEDSAAVLWIDFGAPVTARHGALIGHNLGLTGTIRWTLTDDPAAQADPDMANLIWDREDEAWQPVAGLGYDAFGQSLGGYPDLEALGGYDARRVFDYGGSLSARYLRIAVSDPEVLPAIGVVIHGQGFQPNENVSFGWSIRWLDPAEQIETEGGQIPTPSGPPVRELSVALDHLDRGEALFAANDLHRIAGRRRPVLIELEPQADAPTGYRTSLYGYFTDDDGVTQTDPVNYAAAWTVRELPSE
jgi:hypothetical protein